MKFLKYIYEMGIIITSIFCTKNSLREIKLPKGKFETHLLNYYTTFPLNQIFS